MGILLGYIVIYIVFGWIYWYITIPIGTFLFYRAFKAKYRGDKFILAFAALLFLTPMTILFGGFWFILGPIGIFIFYKSLKENRRANKYLGMFISLFILIPIVIFHLLSYKIIIF
ncbi:hypothetical protein [Xenorhabdus stockiae]|uniref:hypothetical protein n=1 Tax=Xenorhabdus stockiae TaxID=351614 RepID=UPI004064AE5D